MKILSDIAKNKKGKNSKLNKQRYGDVCYRTSKYLLMCKDLTITINKHRKKSGNIFSSAGKIVLKRIFYTINAYHRQVP
ncbi:MAG: hypothetical protein A2168_06710 [Planctomycetes bacterium RBG_13_50_24]|nr:MAG: hypothetical protein A2168_06710 [Planctomycetes bacterium RBG_13_50_24]